MRMREIEELAEYRSLMEAPETYKDGFGWKTVLGALFIGFVMMPGSIYLGLMVGQTMGPAAEWTTIILFTEIARRSFTVLSKQEVYLLYYVAGGLAAGGGTLGLSGGPFAGRFRTDLQQAADVVFDEAVLELRAQLMRCLKILGRAPDTAGGGNTSGGVKDPKILTPPLEEYTSTTGSVRCSACQQLRTAVAQPAFPACSARRPSR